jgi:hypothetical protein
MLSYEEQIDCIDRATSLMKDVADKFIKQQRALNKIALQCCGDCRFCKKRFSNCPPKIAREASC